MSFSNKKSGHSAIGRLRRATAAMGHKPFTVRDLMRRLPDETRGSVDMALSRLAQTGTIRRIGRGIYDRPQMHAVLGELPPDLSDVAEAIARADGAGLVPSGSFAANSLGISTQVPANLIFRTTGRARRVKIGSRTIELRHSTPGRLRAHDRTAATVFEALRSLGQDRVTSQVIQTLRRRLSTKERKQIAKATPDAPAWMHRHLRELTSA